MFLCFRRSQKHPESLILEQIELTYAKLPNLATLINFGSNLRTGYFSRSSIVHYEITVWQIWPNSINLLAQEMLPLPGIILRRWNGLKWCHTLEIALYGNLKRARRGPILNMVYLNMVYTIIRLHVQISKFWAHLRTQDNLSFILLQGPPRKAVICNCDVFP